MIDAILTSMASPFARADRRFIDEDEAASDAGAALEETLPNA